MTNKQMMEIKGVDDEAVQDIVCEYCNTYVIGNYPPSFMCEGRFCNEAWEEWLEEEWEDADIC